MITRELLGFVQKVHRVRRLAGLALARVAVVLVFLGAASWPQTVLAQSVCTFTQITNTIGGGGFEHRSFSINADGTRIAFVSIGGAILLFDTTTGTFTQITNTIGGSSNFVSINADGTRIALASNQNLTGGNPDGNQEIFLFDTTTGRFTQITNTTGGGTGSPSINADGTRIAFRSLANLAGGNPDGNIEIFLFDTTTGTFTQITNTTTSSGSIQSGPWISGDGTRIVYDSTQLTADNPDGSFEIFLWVGGGTIQITNSFLTGTRLLNQFGPISGDGTRIVFSSGLNLTGGNSDRNFEIFLFDNGTFRQITNTARIQITNTGASTVRTSVAPSINAAGNRIAFLSSASDLLTGSNPDGNVELFLWDRAGFTQVTNTVAGLIEFPLVNADGTRIVFRSNRNLTGGNPDGNSEIFVTGCPPPPADELTTAEAGGNNGTVGDPVSTASGEVYDTEADLSLGGPLPLSFSRYYASRLETAGVTSALGNNWMHNFDLSLVRDGNEATILYYDGKKVPFQLVGTVWQLQNPEQHIYQLISAGTDLELMDPANNLIFTFDSTGKLTRIEDRNGNSHLLTYTGSQLTQVIDELGRSLSFTYTSGKLTRVTDQTGRSVSFSYTGDDLTGVTDTRGHVTTYRYTTAGGIAGLLTSKRRPVGNTPFTQIFDSAGRVTTQVDSGGNPTDLDYDTAQGITIVTDPLGNLVDHTHQGGKNLTQAVDQAAMAINLGYDSNGRRNSVVDRLGGTTSFNYHAPSGKLASLINADGTTTTFTYTAQDQGGFTFHDLTGITYPDGTTESFVYDAWGNVLSRTDRATNVWTFTYNSRGQALTATIPSGGVTTYTYNIDGMLATAQDHLGNTTTFSYDTQKRLARITHPDGSFGSFTYDPNDNLLTVTDERGLVTSYSYDANNRLATVTDPLGQTTTHAYDGNDRLATVNDQLGKITTYTYDALRRLASVTNPSGESVAFGYNPQGWLIALTGPGGNTFAKTHDAEGVLSSATNPQGKTWTYTSDQMGRITRIRSPLGSVQNYTHDGMGRLIAFLNPVGQTTTYTYDGRDRLTAMALPGSIVASYTRNGLGQITRITDPNAKPWDRSYDAMGRLTSETDPLAQATLYSYDGRNRASRVTFPIGSLDFTYDESGNITQKLYSDNVNLNYTYDANSRLLTADGLALGYDARGDIISSNGLVITRDDAGRISSITYAPEKIVNYVYNNRGLLSQVIDWVGGATELAYDEAGRVLSITRPNGVTSAFTYDNDGRMTGITEEGAAPLSSIVLTRDGEGKIISAIRNVPLSPQLTPRIQTFTYDDASQISGFSYDSMGRLLADNSQTYVWDLASRLLSYREGVLNTTFTYDGLGMRISRTSGGIAQEFVVNYALGLPSVSVVRQGGNDVRYYIHLPGGRLLHSIEANNARRFYHFDQTGTTLFLSDDGGAITDAYGITEHGEVTSRSGSSDNPFTFVGAYGAMQEGTTSLYYMRARYYDSSTGRFLSRDPVVLIHPRQINPYQYALQDPLLHVDPMGLTNDCPSEPVPAPPGPPAREAARKFAILRERQAVYHARERARERAREFANRLLRLPEEKFLSNPLFAKFTLAAQIREREQWSLATGGLNNITTSVSFGTFGDGCTAWRDWTIDWFNNLSPEEWKQFGIYTVEPVSIPGHSITRLTLTDGRSFILDPWRDREIPVWDVRDYENEFGKFEPGSSAWISYD